MKLIICAAILAQTSCAGACAVDGGLRLAMDVRLQQIVERLTQNDPTLQKLELRFLGIWDAGAQAIADALRQNSMLPLQQLELRLNDIGVAGTQAIEDLLRSNAEARKATRLAAKHLVPRIGVRYNLPGLVVQKIRFCLVPSKIVKGLMKHEAASFGREVLRISLRC